MSIFTRGDQMRIISGTRRGRKLKEPRGLDIRPTSDIVKESIFNIIQFDIEGARVLDLFAGTGQLGIEALSRGARGAVFVDSKPEAARLIRENLKMCGFEDLAEVHTRDALSYLKGGERFDLIFVDPPYDTPLIDKTLSRIIQFDKLNEHGIMICETKAEWPMPDCALPYVMQKQYRYGGVKIARYGRVASGGARQE